MSLEVSCVQTRTQGLRQGFKLQLILCLFLCVLTGCQLRGQDQPQRTLSPHGDLSIGCENCHVSTSWTPIRAIPEFDHDVETRYLLKGSHRQTDCTICHASPVFSNVGTQCADCHADIHRRQFGAECSDCHSTQGWLIALDAIDQHLNRFPLQGAHAAATCESCHEGAAAGLFVGLATECVTCHLDDYTDATAVPHAASGLSFSCENCHGVGQWQSAIFDHSQFPAPLECATCHIEEFTSTANPDHVAGGFPDTCEFCHSTLGWQGAQFDHSQTTFPLTGAHTGESCTSCHVGGQFAGLDAACVSCHANNFDQTTTPNHLAASFPTQCELCHSTSMWLGAVFDHSATRFPLLGAHTGASCTSCHIGDRFLGTPTDCYACHSSEYNSVTDPNHVAAGFPTLCEDCHNNTTWTGAQFDHTFPIYSGAHQGRWDTCSDCHTNSSNFAAFTCLTCHEQGPMDDKHSQIGGYVYESVTCFSCHPMGTH
jgi:hypothetical protein